MNDPNKQELAELVADTRAVLEDFALRGATELPVSPARAEPAVARAEPAVARASVPAVPNPALQAVRDDLGDCRRCGLCADRKNIVFGVGDAQADLVIVGEAPGFQEDKQGEPFVGPAGQMLNNMLKGVFGLDRTEVYIANVVKCRPPKNRNPLPDEVAACMPFLEAQIAAIEPKIILVLGTVALKTMFDTQQGIMRNRGIWKEWRGIPAMATFHPAYLLRNAGGKRHAFADLKACLAKYKELGGKRIHPAPF